MGDDANKNRIEAKNGLENYCYSLKSSISSPEVEGKIPADDKATLEGKIEETISWLDSTPLLRRKNTKRSKRNSKELPCPSCSPWPVPVVCLEACLQVLCPTWAVCLVAPLLLMTRLVVPRSKRSTKRW